jgi:hypothetical protein
MAIGVSGATFILFCIIFGIIILPSFIFLRLYWAASTGAETPDPGPVTVPQRSKPSRRPEVTSATVTTTAVTDEDDDDDDFDW